ncbi:MULTISPECIES: hypothetical protein [unclassified Sphingomonas]|uniref:hypothetical protein n=1 Tax=unclassified Sphingomonas TaxID=196159 RepID=UPI000A498A77|nr:MULTISPECIES: hypothetical protein [unclassified Sphingomonas]
MKPPIPATMAAPPPELPDGSARRRPDAITLPNRPIGGFSGTFQTWQPIEKARNA